MFLLELFLDCEFIQTVLCSLGGIATSNVVQLEKISRSKQLRLKALHIHHVVPASRSFGLDSFGAIGQKCLQTLIQLYRKNRWLVWVFISPFGVAIHWSCTWNRSLISVSLERTFIHVALILCETATGWSKCDYWSFIAKLHSCSIPASNRDAAFEE